MMGERDLEAELTEKDEIIMSLRLNEHLLKDKLEISRRNMSKQLERIDQLEKENKRLRECLDEADDIITSHLSDISITYWRNYCKTLGVDL